MRKVIPTVFAGTKNEFDKKFRKLFRVSHSLQIDLMDGKFVKRKGIRVEDGPNCHDFFGKFEAHLMVNYPSKYLEKLKKRGYKKVIFHIECKENALRVIKMIKKLKMKAWIALNPKTSIVSLENIVDKVDGVMFMGVFPGREGQKFVTSIYRKIMVFHKLHPKVKIQVDGGVNLETVGKLKDVGVNIVNSGSYVSESENPKKALKMLKKKFK
jgi:ribulose-phosphate 3-epimerase